MQRHDEEVISPERWEKLREIFHAAFEQGDRRTYLNKACAGDEELRQEAESLLTANDNLPKDFLQTPAFAFAMQILADENRGDEMDSETTQVFALPLGEVIDGRYKIVEKLAMGGMSEVYKTQDLKVGRPVVIKVLKKEAKIDSWIVRKFQAGGQVQGLINHPCVETIFDIGTLPNVGQYLVVEFIEGKTLKDYQKGKGRQLAISEVREIMEQVCDAVTAIHSKGVIHRDLKPANIMVRRRADTGKFEVKVIDFGIMRKVDENTEVNKKPGSPAFMSPEQKEGQEKLTFASDVYALGLITNVALMGRHPFYPNYFGVNSRLSAGQSILRFPAKRVIRKAIADDAGQRQQSARAFFEELVRALSFWRRITAATAVVLIALIIGAVAWQRFSSESGDASVVAHPDLKAAPDRGLNYSLWLKNSKRDPNGQLVLPRDIIVKAGDEVRLTMNSPQTGYLYVINERPPQANRSVKFNVLFPITVNNRDSAAVAANQPFQIPPRSRQPKFDWLALDQEKGREKIWLVWSEQIVRELEAVKVWVNPKDRGEIRDQSQAEAVKQYLTAHSTTAPKAELDEARKLMKLTGKGSVLIGLIEMEHR